jgi:hypothetical protein
LVAIIAPAFGTVIAPFSPLLLLLSFILMELTFVRYISPRLLHSSTSVR